MAGSVEAMRAAQRCPGHPGLHDHPGVTAIDLAKSCDTCALEVGIACAHAMDAAPGVRRYLALLPSWVVSAIALARDGGCWCSPLAREALGGEHAPGCKALAFLAQNCQRVMDEALSDGRVGFGEDGTRMVLCERPAVVR